MSRDVCIVITPREEATDEERQLISLAIAMREPPFDHDADDGNLFVYVEAGHNPKRVEKAIMRCLAASEVAGAVMQPLRIGRWDLEQNRYVYDTAGGDSQAEPVVTPDQIGWAVDVQPRSAFDWKELRAELAGRGRTALAESDHILCVGARDEADAQALIAELLSVEVVKTASARPLSWFRRWQIRERFLGNYGSLRDPTPPV